jgi:hypothetical protein
LVSQPGTVAAFIVAAAAAAAPRGWRSPTDTPLWRSPLEDRLAKHVLPRRINEIVHGKRAIPADAALRLSRALGLTDMFWIINATEG